MDNNATAVIASHLPDLKQQDLGLVTRLLDLLRIRISPASLDNQPRLRIHVANKNLDHATGDATALDFDLNTRSWDPETGSASSDTPSCSPSIKSPNTPERTSPGTIPRSPPSRGPPTRNPSLSPETNRLDKSKDYKDKDTESKEDKDKDDRDNNDQSMGNKSKQHNQDKADWTAHIPRSEHNLFLMHTHWDKTPLGSMSSWPEVLQLMTLKMLADPRPANLYWGRERIAIYNEPFAIMAHSRHPAMMGASAADSMPATWPFLKVIMQEVQDSYRAFSLPEFEMEVHKANGFLEEAWYDGIFSPVVDTDGRFQGLYNSGYEITNTVLTHRYARLVHQIAATPDFDRQTPWGHVVQSCEQFERDVPMLMVYSANVKPTSRSDHCTLHLKGSLGIRPAHDKALLTFDLDDSTHLLAPAFRSSKSLGHPVLLDTAHESFEHFQQDIDWRGWREPSTLVVVMPILTNGLIAGFVIMGLNPRRPYDNELEQLVQDVWKTVTSVVSLSTSFDQAREREKVLTRELTQRERFIRTLAEIANVGIYSLSPTGILTYANPKFHDMVDVTLEPGNGQAIEFERFVSNDDLLKITEAHEECIAQRTSVSLNVRLKRTWVPPGASAEQPCWVLNSIMPDVEDGQVRGVIGSLSDIGHTMWALQLQKDSTDAALESKRHLEQFIDMTSHEVGRHLHAVFPVANPTQMRNPLGATIQCAEDIARVIDEAKASYRDGNLSELFESISENAKTIAFCSSHQKAIADDILVVSKLSSSLLSVSSARCQPESVARQVVRMFKAEATKATIDLDMEIHPSYSINWALCDASRIRQILINLVSNSLKFTKSRDKRRIKVIVGSSNIAPPRHMEDLQWHPRELPPPILTDNNEVFLTLQVQDTGKGLSRDEMAKLFNRFAQASSAISSTYGGSGLGLFISMQLAELQGGRIGLSSKPEEGSTFGFYIKIKKTMATEEEERSIRRISATLQHQSSKLANKPLDILLVEDNLINARVLSKQLRAKGHQVHLAIHEQEALEFLRTTKYWRNKHSTGVELDIILMDWEMPVLNGIDCTKQVRQLEQEHSITKHLPIIVTSANARPEQIEVAYAAGTDEFLAKPFTVNQVLEKIVQMNY